MKTTPSIKLVHLPALTCAALFALSALLLGPLPAHATLLRFNFTDGVGQDSDPGFFYPIGAIDLTGLQVTFDDTTGAYEATFTAAAANPFQGDFRLNINLFNPDTGFGNAATPSAFNDTGNDFHLGSPQTTVILTGTSSNLTFWDVGDRVAANGSLSGPTAMVNLGVPAGPSIFVSGVLDLNNTSLGDRVGYGQFTTIAPVPEPGTALFGLALSGALVVGRQRKRSAV